MRSKIIGYAGYMGAGKTTFINSIHESICIINVDNLAKDLYNTYPTMVRQVVVRFGTDVLKNDKVDFKLLGEKAFINDDSLQSLNEIVFPYIVNNLYWILETEKTKHSKIVVEAAVLPILGIEDWFHELYWIDVPQEVRVERILKSRDIDKESLLQRMKIQESICPVPTGKKWKIINAGVA